MTAKQQDRQSQGAIISGGQAIWIGGQCPSADLRVHDGMNRVRTTLPRTDEEARSGFIEALSALVLHARTRKEATTNGR